MFTRKKKTFVALLALILIPAILAGCKPEPEKKEKSHKTEKKEITKADNSEESTKQQEEQKTRMVKLYFADTDAKHLIPEQREVFDSSLLLQNTLEELIKGPKEEGHAKTIPDGTKILGVSTNGDVVLINFSRELVDNHPGGSASELITVYSVVDTITEFSGFKKVKFLVEGQDIESLTGHLDLTQPVPRDESMIEK